MQRCLSLSLLRWLCRFPGIAKAKILLCATFNAQVAEHFSQILPFTFPSDGGKHCDYVCVCVSLHSADIYNIYICRIFWLFYLWSQQQCNKIKLLCVSLSLTLPHIHTHTHILLHIYPIPQPNRALSYLWLAATLAANRCALVKCAKFIAYFWARVCACGCACVCVLVRQVERVRAMPILHPFDWPSCRLKLYNATRKTFNSAYVWFVISPPGDCLISESLNYIASEFKAKWTLI